MKDTTGLYHSLALLLRVMSVESKYKLQSVQDALTKKDWAAGSPKPEEFTEVIIGGGNPTEKITYAPAWSKIVDEILVNASDHILRCVNEKLQLVDDISVIANTDMTEITVSNTGAGIPVCVHKEATKALDRGHDIYVVEFIFGELFQGSNTDKPEVTAENILETLIGGTNGIGAKATNSYSTEFTVRTFDATRQLYYEQKWTNGMRVCHPPTIKAAKDLPAAARKPFTEITFKPDYKGKFGTTMTKALATQYMRLIRTRVILLALYANFACARERVRPPTVRFNNVLLSSYKKTADVAKAIYPDAVRITGMLIPGEKKKTPYTIPWEVTIVITPVDKHIDNITIVNGMVTHDGGHIKRARAAIVGAVKNAIESKINESDMRKVTNNVNTHTFLVMCCQIPNPDWTGQRKDVVKQSAKVFDHYDVEQKFSKAIAKALVELVRDDITEKAAKKEAPTTVGKMIIPPDVYTPALGAGGKNWEHTALCLCEGSSALQNAKRGNLPREQYGFLSLQGVPMNARRESEVESTSDDSRQYATQSARLQKNRGWNMLQAIVGLDANNSYKVMSKLNYGVLIMIVDQDNDGKGNILGSFLSMFGKIWPNLIRRGYVKWFATPIIRAFPTRGKGRVAAFYNEHAYAEWAASKDAFPHRTRYFKGIGGHNDRETVSMFKNMENHLYTFTLDEKSETLFEVYFGADPNKRKRVLSRPIRILSFDEQKRIDDSLVISCSTHMTTDTDWYQRDNLERKLDHMIDGQNQAGRKILNSLIRISNRKDPLKVAQFAGSVAENEDYHHAETSLENSIFGRGFIAVGGKQLPFVRPFGGYGTRACGGHGHVSARYGHLLANAPLLKLLFPDEDYCLLEFHFTDGIRKEPKNFVPIVPLAVCESASLPSHGWALNLWARYLPDVIEHVRAMIANDNDGISSVLRPYAYRNVENPYTGEVCIIDGEEYSYGKYRRTANQIIITELPLRVWTDKYVADLQKKIGNGIVADVQNDDTNLALIHIIVTLEPGAYDVIAEKKTAHHDGIIEYFGLRKKLTSHINLMSPYTSVVEFQNYSDVVRAWYPYRKYIYYMRAERRIIVLELKSRYYQNIIRYIETANENRFAKRKISEMETYLKEHKYDMFHKKYVDNPGFTDNDEIYTKVFGPKANYNYLIDLTDRNKSEESLNRYKAKLSEIDAELEKTRRENSMGAFQGSYMWEEELNQLEILYYEGAATGWTFGDEDGYEYDE